MLLRFSQILRLAIYEITKSHFRLNYEQKVLLFYLKLKNQIKGDFYVTDKRIRGTFAHG